MFKLVTIAACAALVAGKSSLNYRAGPQFAPSYTASGYILLPYCELREPFTAYYDSEKAKSRVDYYEGEMKTFQIGGNEQVSYKVVWSPNKATHKPELKCFTDASADPRSVLPKLDDFVFIRTEPCYESSSSLLHHELKDSRCFRYEKSEEDFERTSTYTFWARQDERDRVVPVRYTMMGYDSLLGSHFDKYEVIYTSYEEGVIDGDVFDVKSVFDGKCESFPSPPGISVKHLFNPIGEFVHNADKHVDEHFGHFKADFGKQYEGHHEERERHHNFRHNLRYVNSMNRRNLSYALKVNHRSDWSEKEFRVLRGRLQSPSKASSALPFPSHEFKRRNLPDYVDWRLEGAVSPVKDQAICGSCWSFGTVAHLEGAYFLKFGKMVKFAEQQLVDCSWNEGNDACDGGIDYIAYDYIKKYGLASDEQYGPYRGIDGKCKDLEIKEKPIQTLKNYTDVKGTENMKKALAFVGPVSIALNASPRSFSFYSHGIYKDPKCTPDVIDHAVLAVGYGTLHGEAYWLIKNSWSTYWGNDGYILISQENDLCGVTTSGTYVTL